MIILGISCYYHDSAAAIIRDGRVLAAAQEERFTRTKHDSSFPRHAIRFCLDQAKATMQDVDVVVYYENSRKKASRIASTILTNVPASKDLFVRFAREWLCGKYFARHQLRKELRIEFGSQANLCEIREIDHHLSHAASAFYPSPFQDAAILIADGVGEWATTSLGFGSRPHLRLDHSVNFPNSIGLLYSTFTAFLGFKVNSGEYKVMGLAPYGTPSYSEIILNNLISVAADGSFCLNMDYFTFAHRSNMFDRNLELLLGVPSRKPESDLTAVHLDIASSIQEVTNYLMINMARRLHRECGTQNLCLAGGVALNCITNARILSESGFKKVWIQPAAGDAGGALGSAIYVSNELEGQRDNDAFGLADSSYCLGPQFSHTCIELELKTLEAVYYHLEEQELLDAVTDAIVRGEAIGWFQGRMEFGPRALGSRSILADARSKLMQRELNRKIKFRESFRPFAPAILEECVSEWYDWNGPSPYMLFVATLSLHKRKGNYVSPMTGIDLQSPVPAVTHVDYSSRIQTVSMARNRRFYLLLRRFYDRTGCPMLLNTSFNIRGEPIVCSPRDAYRCFMGTDLDLLVIENFALRKDQQNRLALAQYRDAIPLD
jgi:carbamoyltransferase